MIQRRFSDVRIKHTEISPTIERQGGGGGGNLPMVLVTKPKVTMVKDENTDNTERPGWGGDAVELCRTCPDSEERHEAPRTDSGDNR